MERLLKKFETAKSLVPAPLKFDAPKATKYGVIYFGSTTAAMDEAILALNEKNILLDRLRIRAYPFNDSVIDFIKNHDRVYVVEQNRDAQLRTLLLDTGKVDPSRLTSVLHYDGNPITARFIVNDISLKHGMNKPPLKESVT
jgi:2-oxoglutarate ferredoxin oxidoreductase subunit alpha